MSIVLRGEAFNGLYLKSLRAALSGAYPHEDSRAGKVINIGQAYLEVQGNDPRLIFLNGRKINPVFAIVEAAWILSGRNDLATLSEEIPSFSNYSDDGVTLNGAYGYRLRSYFGRDQIELAIKELRADPASRRVVLTMYAPDDIGKQSRDIPCNTTIFVKVRASALDITVVNRSNDLYKGVPYNVFVFGVLQRYLARVLELPVGIQRHFTDGLHLYEADIENAKIIIDRNNDDMVNDVSDQFSWDYVDGLIESCEEIASGNYGEIRSEEMRRFLTQYCARSRAEMRKENKPFSCTADFLSFLGHQWISDPSRNQGDTWMATQRALMMNSEIKCKFSLLATQSCGEIVVQVNGMADRLNGKYYALKKIIDEKSGPLGFKDFGGDERMALKALLLSLIQTSYDPHVAGSFIGDHMKEQLAAACAELGVPASAVGPVSSLERPLLEALEEMLG